MSSNLSEFFFAFISASFFAFIFFSVSGSIISSSGKNSLPAKSPTMSFLGLALGLGSDSGLALGLDIQKILIALPSSG